jgi:predicted RNase H-like HicB family nuclease
VAALRAADAAGQERSGAAARLVKRSIHYLHKLGIARGKGHNGHRFSIARAQPCFWVGCIIPFMATYRVVLRQSEEGYSVSCPGLPGCWSQGGTEEEALANIRIAIREYVEAAEELARNEEGRVVEVAVA